MSPNELGVVRARALSIHLTSCNQPINQSNELLHKNQFTSAVSAGRSLWLNGPNSDSVSGSASVSPRGHPGQSVSQFIAHILRMCVHMFECHSCREAPLAHSPNLVHHSGEPETLCNDVWTVFVVMFPTSLRRWATALHR